MVEAMSAVRLGHASRLWLVAMAGVMLGLLILGGGARAADPAPGTGGELPGGSVSSAESIATPEDLARSYHLGPGDRIRVIVYQEPDLSGEFEVDSSGRVSLPLINEINAQNLTIKEFQDAVAAKLRAGFLVNPRVSAEITNYRPFYITGEVTRPGEYPYVAGMNILKAVAMAGGYTYRANTSRVVLTRHETGKEQSVDPNSDMMVLPGDVIRVKERFF